MRTSIELTDEELEFLNLKRENRKLRKELDEIRSIHMLDQAEIIRLRRMLEAAVDG